MTAPIPPEADLRPEDAPPAGVAERRIAINSGLLLAAYGFQAAVSLVIVGLVARYLGQAGLGRYGFVISFIELFIAFIDLGMNRILVREISRKLDWADRYASAIWTLRLILALIALGIVGLVAAGRGDSELWLAIMVYYLAQTFFLLADVFNSVFHGFQRMEYQFWGVNLSQLFLLAFTVAVIGLDAGLVALFGARLAANGLKLLFVWWISQRRFAKAHILWGVIPGALVGLRSLPAILHAFRRPPAGGGLQLRARLDQAKAPIQVRGRSLAHWWRDATLAWRMLIESMPVGVSLVLRSYIWRGGIVLTVLWLGQQQGDLANGLLYGPLRIVQQMRIVPAAFAAAMLPVFSNRAVDRLAEFDSAFAKSIKLFTAISLLIALAFTFLADPIVALLLGQGVDLAGASQVLTLLGWVIVLYFPNWLYGVTLVAQGRQRLETLGLALGLATGYCVARWGIPRFEALGVSAAILAAEGVFFLVGAGAMWRHFHWRRLAPSLGKIVLSCAAAGAVFAGGHLLWSRLAAADLGLGGLQGAILELLTAGGAGLLVCGAMLFLLRAFDSDEKAAIRAMLSLQRGRA